MITKKTTSIVPPALESFDFGSLYQDDVQEQVDEFLEGWEKTNKGAWKQMLQLIIVASVFVATLSLLGYFQYTVYKFNVKQVMHDLRR